MVINIKIIDIALFIIRYYPRFIADMINGD